MGYGMGFMSEKFVGKEDEGACKLCLRMVCGILKLGTLRVPPGITVPDAFLKMLDGVLKDLCLEEAPYIVEGKLTKGLASLLYPSCREVRWSATLEQAFRCPKGKSRARKGADLSINS